MPSFRPRFGIRALLVLVACCAIGSWAWVDLMSPSHRWQRAIRSDNESSHRWEAARAAISGKVDRLGRTEAIEAFVQALSDPSPRVRETAVWALRGLPGPEARLAIPGLIGALKDPSSSIRFQAVRSLGSIVQSEPAGRPPVIPALVGLLTDRNPEVRVRAGFWLSQMGRGEVAAPVLARAIREGHDADGFAALGLGLSGSTDPAAAAALKLAAEGSYDPGIRKMAVEALARIEAARIGTPP